MQIDFDEAIVANRPATKYEMGTLSILKQVNNRVDYFNVMFQEFEIINSICRWVYNLFISGRDDNHKS